MSDVDTSRYDGTVERTADGGVIRFERHLAYPVREVWDAITNPARLAAWWLPFDADITVDLREGGQIVMTGTGDEAMTITCAILRVEPPMLLEHTHAEPGSHMRWELEPVDSGCVLRLTHFVPERGQGDRQLLRRRPAPRSPGSCRAWTVARPHGTGMPSRRRRRSTPTSASHRRLLRNTPPSKRKRVFGPYSPFVESVSLGACGWRPMRTAVHAKEDMVNIEVSMTLAEAVDEFPHLARVRAPRAGLLLRRPAHTRRRVWARRLGPGDRRRGALGGGCDLGHRRVDDHVGRCPGRSSRGHPPPLSVGGAAQDHRAAGQGRVGARGAASRARGHRLVLRRGAW